MRDGLLHAIVDGGTGLNEQNAQHSREMKELVARRQLVEPTKTHKKRCMKKQLRNILVRATNWVGDAVMSAPALQALRAAYPQAHIAILARPWVAGLYAHQSFCDELIAYELPPGWESLQAKRRLAVALRRRNFDCAILLQNAFEAAALTRWARIPVRVGYARDARGWLLTHPIGVPRTGEILPHQRFYYLEMLRRAGLIQGYATDRPIRLDGAAAAATEARAHLRARLGGVVIAVSPGAAFGGAKRWPATHFAAAAVRVARARAAAVAVFGSQEDEKICATVCAAVRAASVPCVSFAGTTTIGQYCEMVAACQLVLTNDFRSDARRLCIRGANGGRVRCNRR